MCILEKHKNITALVLTHLETGKKKERLKLLEQPEDTEDILSLKKMKERKLFMLESPHLNNLITWITKSNILKKDIQLMNLSRISDQVLISKEEVLERFWTNYSLTISKKLWLPLKTDCVDSGMNYLNTCFTNLEQDWKFLIPMNMSLKHQTKSSQKTCYQSFQFLQTDTMDQGNTKIPKKNRKIIKKKDQNQDQVPNQIPIEKRYITKKIKIHPTREQKKFFSKCFGTTRYLYNKIIDYIYKEEEKNYNEHLEKAKHGCCFSSLKGKKKEEKKLVRCHENLDSESKFFCKEHINSKIKRSYKIDRISLRNKLFPKNSELTEENSWLEEIPYDTRQLVITEFLGAFDSAMSNLKNGNIQKFRMTFKSKRNINHIFHCDHRTLKVTKERKKNHTKVSIDLFPKLKLGNFRIRLKEKKKIFCFLDKEKNDKKNKKGIDIFRTHNDFKVAKQGNDYYLLLNIEEKDFKDSEKPPLKSVALDPGKRTFQTFYSPDGIAGKLGDNYYDDKITPLNKRIDLICSARDKIKKLSNKTRKNKQTIKNMNRRLSLLRTKIKNKIRDMHWKTANFLCKNFETIIIPEFETQKMADKEQRKINKETTRGILGLSHYAFRMRLTHQIRKRNNLLITVQEPYTSKTCGNCGNEQEINSKKTFDCLNCKKKIDRDYNGARNILIRTLTKHSLHE